MYVPSYECLLRSLRTNKEVLETSNEITIPVALLNLLLQLAVAHCDFDEDVYLGANPDVREAVRRGHVESGQMHYIGYGYFEGRRGGTVKIDEQIYMREPRCRRGHQRKADQVGGASLLHSRCSRGSQPKGRSGGQCGGVEAGVLRPVKVSLVSAPKFTSF
jgi:hypothetical protein